MTKKKVTLRQRLRNAAESKLQGLLEQATEAAAEICKGTSVDKHLLMQLASTPNGGKTLRNDLITKLANDAEAELEKLYNNQMALPGVDDDERA